MAIAQDSLDQQFLEMRWRVLSLAADLDRLDRRAPGAASDARREKLQRAFRVLLEARHDRAEQVQMIFSDLTPPPSYNRKSEIGNRK